MCDWYNPFFGKCEGRRFKDFDCDRFFRLGVKILENIVREKLKDRKRWVEKCGKQNVKNVN